MPHCSLSLWIFFSILSFFPALLLAQPCPVSGTSSTNETCAGNNNGTANINISPVSSYSYTWQPNISTSNSANNLPPGNYTVTITGGSGGAGGSAVTLFADNFNAGTAAWTLNTGSGTNQWSADANYTGLDCLFLGSPLFSVPDVPMQPIAVAGSPYSTYLHIRATNSGSGFCDPPWPPTNANYDAGQASNRCTEMTTPISTSGYGNIGLSFYWLSVGSPNAYGYVQYSTGGGWTSVGGNFNNNSNWLQATINNTAFDNQASIKFRFCWTNGSTGDDPPFSIDDVKITGQVLTPPCSSVVNFSIAPGTSVNPAFTSLGSNYCSSDAATTLIPVTSGGTFAGEGVSANTFNPRFVTTLGTAIPITYTVTVNGCTATSTQMVTVSNSPDATFTTLNANYLTSDPPVVLSAITSGGTFSGACVVSNVFIPSTATPGLPCTITYTVSANGCTQSTQQTVTVNTPGPTGVLAELKIMLQAPYNTGTGNMSTYLRINNILPLSQPYNTAPWNYTGSENLATHSAMPTTASDWILVELRDATNPNTIIAQRAGFVLSNGVVVSHTGTTGVTFGGVTSGNYYLAVRHRNHLAVMSSVVVNLPNTGNPYDFTLSAVKVMGVGQSVLLAPNVWAMHAADFNANGVITFDDYNRYQTQILTANTTGSYFNADATFDGNVNGSDFGMYALNARLIGIPVLRY